MRSTINNRKDLNLSSSDFCIEGAIEFLDNPNSKSLKSAFNWSKTPQGFTYWSEIYGLLNRDPLEKVPDKAIVQVQRWVIDFLMMKRRDQVNNGIRNGNLLT